MKFRCEEDAAAYQDNDYFDVQGKREREEKVCQSKLETAKVQSETETKLAEVDRDKALELQTIQLEKEQVRMRFVLLILNPIVAK